MKDLYRGPYSEIEPNRRDRWYWFLRIMSVALLGALTGSPCLSAPSEFDLVFVLTEDMMPAEFPEDVRDLDDLDGEVAGRGGGTPLGTINLAELSPLNMADFAAGRVRVAIYSPWGYIPRYRINGQISAAMISGPGDISLSDYGAGVADVVARQPQINNSYDYDPSDVGKNGDDEPAFQGTLQGLSMGGDELYRTRGSFFGSWNYFTLIVAVGPQFFTPTGTIPVSVELQIVTF